MERMIDLKAMQAEMDTEDEELMQFFRNRREKIDDKVLVYSGKRLSIVTKDELARAIKNREDMVKAFADIFSALSCMATLGMMIARALNPFVCCGILSAILLSYAVMKAPRK